MPSPLVQALEKISFWINNSNSDHAKTIREGYSNCRPKITDYLPQPGLEREMLELYAEEINFQLSEEIYELYQWHNGEFEIGDVSNPVFFVSFERGFDCYAKEFRKFPIFIGDDLYYFVEESTDNKKFSPIYQYDGRPFLRDPNHLKCLSYYAPSITDYMQAVAECIVIFDEISVTHSSNKYRDYQERREYLQEFSAIYEKHGVVTDTNKIWG